MLQVGGATVHSDTAKRIVSEFNGALQQVYGMVGNFQYHLGTSFS